MTTHRKPKTKNFSIIDNEFMNDPLLDWDAKGMLAYLLSKPDDWRVNKTGLINAVQNSGEVKVESILKKLEVAGYLVRWQSRDTKGKIYYGAEILECFRDREDVLNALLERETTNKYFKISVGRFSQCGKNGATKADKGKKSLSAMKKQPQGSTKIESSVTVFSATGEPEGGKPPHILNTDLVKTELIKTELIKDPLYPPKGELLIESAREVDLICEKDHEAIKPEPTSDKSEPLSISVIKNPSDVPLALAKRTKKKGEAAELAWFQEAYNCNKPENWAACHAMNEARVKSLKKMVKEMGLETAKELWQMALAHIKTSEFFTDPSKNSFGFDSIFYKNRVVQWAEAWQASIATEANQASEASAAFSKYSPFLDCFNQDHPMTWPNAEQEDLTHRVIGRLEALVKRYDNSLERFQKALLFAKRDKHWGLDRSLTLEEFLFCEQIDNFYKKQVHAEANGLADMVAPSKMQLRTAQEQHAGKIRARESNYRILTDWHQKGEITDQEYEDALEKAGIPLASARVAC
jgi:tetratricopeptide (TPR) repeat protein